MMAKTAEAQQRVRSGVTLLTERRGHAHKFRAKGLSPSLSSRALDAD